MKKLIILLCLLMASTAWGFEIEKRGMTYLVEDASGKLTQTTTLNAATGNEVAYTLNYTINKATSGDDTGLLINMTDTASPGTSYLIDAQVGGSSKFNVNNAGNLNLGGTNLQFNAESKYITTNAQTRC